MNLDELLKALKDGVKTIEEVKLSLQSSQLEEMGDVVVDLQREARCGLPEVVYGRTKSVEQIVKAAALILEKSGKVLVTRVSEEQSSAVLSKLPGCEYNPRARAVYKLPPRSLDGKVLVICAGTSDVNVAEEALVSCSMFGVEAELLVDVGVAGLQRLLKNKEKLLEADCIIVCAGMEGALPSVVGGLVKVPVIAVPVSSGYGASLGGMSALLGMLNSCASGLTVVNIDNGFGAGYAAGRIMLLANKK